MYDINPFIYSVPILLLKIMAAQPLEPQHNHGDLDGDGMGVDSGLSEHSERFRTLYDLRPGFDIKCSDCCRAYLVGTRSYTQKHGRRIVKFGGVHTNTPCYVDGAQGNRGVKGVVKTGHDIDLGELVKRPVCGSHSYQLYRSVPGQQVHLPPGLAIGENVTARIEAIAAKELRETDLRGCSLSYGDAALLELYRATLSGVASHSMLGACWWPSTVPTQEPGVVDKLANMMEQLQS